MSKTTINARLILVLIIVSVLGFYSCEKLVGPTDNNSGTPTIIALSIDPLPPGYDAIVFDGRPAGTIVDTIYSYHGEGPVNVWGTNPGPYVTESNGTVTPTTNAAIIFDSSNPTGGDCDLGSPHSSHGGPGCGDGGDDPGSENDTELEEILIIAENLIDDDPADGLIDDPDDAGVAGSKMEFDFTNFGIVTIHSMNYIDVEGGESVPVVNFYNSIGGFITSINLETTGDNGVKTHSFGGVPNVGSMEVILGGSGGIDNIVFEQGVESLSCLLTIEKKTNDVDADSPDDAPEIIIGNPVNWTYELTNTDVVDIHFDHITLYDTSATTETALTPSWEIATQADPSDSLLSPQETWIYTANGTAVDLEGQVYENLVLANAFVVSVTDDTSYCEAQDLSHYKNPESLNCGVTIEKTTNGIDADDQGGIDAPEISPGDPITWTYTIENTGEATYALADITITDSEPGITPVYVSGDANIPNVMEPGEIWIYEASGTAQNLGGEGQLYENLAEVEVYFLNPGSGQRESCTDQDYSHYKNPDECQECEGKVSQLVIRYDGLEAADIVVMGKRGPTTDTLFVGNVGSGASFTVNGLPHKNWGFEGTLGTEIRILVNDALATTIHTSCSQPIGPGMTFGNFYILTGESKYGGELCPCVDCEQTSSGDDDDDDDDDDDVDTMVICHKGKTKTIPVSAWPDHQEHGDTEGDCTTSVTGDDDDDDVDTMVICHKGRTKTIPVSAWSDHQGHGDTEGACE